MSVTIRAKGEDHVPTNVKQVLVIRKLYPDGSGGLRKIRSGKLASQAAHASMAWLVERVCNASKQPLESLVGKLSAYPGVEYTSKLDIGFTTEERAWLTGKFTKVVLGVDTEEELEELFVRAQEAGLTVRMITDSGATEFAEPTKTAIAIGPHNADRIDPLTQGLNLL